MNNESNMSKLLVDEYPLIVLPSLAEKIGLNEAIILQQIHYWIRSAEKRNDENKSHEGRWWVYNSYEQWSQDNFSFWSVSTIRRAISNLEKMGLIITEQLKANQHDQTKWYTIDYDKLNDLLVNERTDRTVQNEQIEPVKMNSSLINREHTETTNSLKDENHSFDEQIELELEEQPKQKRKSLTSEEYLKQLETSVAVGIINSAKKAERLKRIDLRYIPPDLQVLAEKTIELFGRGPSAKEKGYWIKQWKEQRDLNLEPKHLEMAYMHLRREGLSIGSPGSLTKVADDLRRKESERLIDLSQEQAKPVWQIVETRPWNDKTDAFGMQEDGTLVDFIRDSEGNKIFQRHKNVRAEKDKQ